MKFIVKSAVLLVIINIGFGILVPILMNVINNAIADNDVQRVIGSVGAQSFASWLVTAVLMCRVLWEDGKKNTAYQIFDTFFAAICFTVMFFVYFAPVIFIDNAGDTMLILLSHYYTTCEWLRGERLGYTTAAACAALLAIAPMAAAYFASHAMYVKKHPDL